MRMVEMYAVVDEERTNDRPFIYPPIFGQHLDIDVFQDLPAAQRCSKAAGNCKVVRCMIGFDNPIKPPIIPEEGKWYLLRVKDEISRWALMFCNGKFTHYTEKGYVFLGVDDVEIIAEMEVKQ